MKRQCWEKGETQRDALAECERKHLKYSYQSSSGEIHVATVVVVVAAVMRCQMPTAEIGLRDVLSIIHR